ncbi:dihydropyrimidinase [Gordonia jinghuaiqii]|uniref:Dihydropyrimidinase n=1 Tax=Gordonia jinghuaiqii TaxID=2758710 RepID=A0A7D7LZC4_9ACTN|nr:dihydropyrimidinase [Gordonia jinghuaiqii]MCR5977837.1 dihydropyrimidinase [Gordonia jinghuaiqii]QMT02494.1 dihydropyrimidinase [Gordonia jinghuaiqii]
MTRRILLRGGHVVDEQSITHVDVLIIDGAIAEIGQLGEIADAEIVDCTGKLVLPGGVDAHTHMDSKSFDPATSDDFYTGTRAAAVGGTTTIIDYSAQLPGLDVWDSVQSHAADAADKAVIDWGLHAQIARFDDTLPTQLGELARSGVTSVKTFMAYRGALMLNDGELFEVLRTAGSAGMQVCVHAENGDVIDVLARDLVNKGVTGPRGHLLSRPPETEAEAVSRAIRISRMADAPLYLVHLSTEESAQLVAEARREDWPITAETCTHYLTLGPELYDAPDFEGAKAVLTPPLREKHHHDALWSALDTGVLGIVSSDHCPYCFDGQKSLGRDDFRRIPNGGPGVEHRMIVTWSEGVASGRLTPNQFVKVTAAEPARQFGLYPRKGVLAPGSDADIVILDPEGTTSVSAENQVQNVDYTLWEGWSLTGRIDAVYSRGDLIAHDGVLTAEGDRAGRGRYLTRASAGTGLTTP